VLSVVIVTWNSARHLPRLLASLPEALLGVRQWQLVVVDNDSADDTVSLVRTMAPHAELVETGGNLGYAAAVNRGTAVVPGSDVLVLNPDVALRPYSVARLLTAIRTDPTVGIAVPRLVDEEGVTRWSLRRAPTVLRQLGEALLGGRRAAGRPRLGEVVDDQWAYEHAHDAEWATGAVMLVSRRCLDLVGLWDESFFLYSEETDYALRARDAGLRVRYEPSAVAEHSEGDAQRRPELWAFVVRNKVRLHARRAGTASGLLMLLAVLANETVRAPFSALHRHGLRALLAPSGLRSLLRPGPPFWSGSGDRSRPRRRSAAG
jgi:N-acetylglucosaminyl-diphospho-decaprenol L-rhamnosyltransferase